MEQNSKSIFSSVKKVFRSNSHRSDKVQGKCSVYKKREFQPLPTELKEELEKFDSITHITAPVIKSSTLPVKRSHLSLDRSIPPHSIRVLPPRTLRKYHPPAPNRRITLPPVPQRITHTTSSSDILDQSDHRIDYNVEETMPRESSFATPHHYSEPYHWLVKSPNDIYTTISPRHHSWKLDPRQNGYASLQVSASMIDLRSSNDYMQINRTTLNSPVASDYQQPIAIQQTLPAPLIVRERQKRLASCKKSAKRGTIVILDENKTLVV